MDENKLLPPVSDSVHTAHSPGAESPAQLTLESISPDDDDDDDEGNECASDSSAEIIPPWRCESVDACTTLIGAQDSPIVLCLQPAVYDVQHHPAPFEDVVQIMPKMLFNELPTTNDGGDDSEAKTKSSCVEQIPVAAIRYTEDEINLNNLADYVIKHRLLSVTDAFDSDCVTPPAGSEHSRQQLQQNFMANTAIRQWLARSQYSMAINLVRGFVECARAHSSTGTSLEFN
jgi:hypothetical protein